MSTAIQIVRYSGFLLVKPVATSFVCCGSAEVVKYPDRNMCWSAAGSIEQCNYTMSPSTSVFVESIVNNCNSPAQKKQLPRRLT